MASMSCDQLWDTSNTHLQAGMANGTNKPGYMNSFMSFLEKQDVPNQDDPDDPESVPDFTSASGEDDGQDLEREKEKEVNDEVKVEVSAVTVDPPEEEITPTDHTPADNPPQPSGDQPSATDGENTNSSEATSVSEGADASKGGRRNVARRGKRKSGAAHGSTAEITPQRENLRRTARNVKRYGHLDLESDGIADSDPDFHLSDSDDDPDFHPAEKKAHTVSDDEEESPRRGRGRGRGSTTHRGVFSPQGRGRGIKRAHDKDSSTSSLKSPTITTPPKRRGRPPSYQTVKSPVSAVSTEGNSVSNTGGSVTVTQTQVEEVKAPSKLSSAYNYAGGRVQRQNQTIRLPEGPQLTAEQLEMVESQFKSGDFVMAKKDLDQMENPPIWRIDGKSLLQKFQAFEKDGKTLYRNISTYSGWTSQAKALYLGVNVTFVFQSRYDTVVQMVGFKPQGEETEAPKDDSKQSWSTLKSQQMDFEISEELRSHMQSFEIYLQTLISQALDNNFLVEIYQENDDYFVERVKVIDELAEQRKNKVLDIVKWNDQFKNSLDTWPCVNVMIKTSKTVDTCQACSRTNASKLFQLYGQPYSQQTLRYREPLPTESSAKNFDVCENCSNISQLYNKVCHQKYDYYSQCKSKVTNMRVADPKKATTTILQDLLANDHWITKLFRSMCTTWIKVDRLYQDEKGRDEQPTT